MYKNWTAHDVIEKWRQHLELDWESNSQENNGILAQKFQILLEKNFS